MIPSFRLLYDAYSSAFRLMIAIVRGAFRFSAQAVTDLTHFIVNVVRRSVGMIKAIARMTWRTITYVLRETRTLVERVHRLLSHILSVLLRISWLLFIIILPVIIILDPLNWVFWISLHVSKWLAYAMQYSALSISVLIAGFLLRRLYVLWRDKPEVEEGPPHWLDDLMERLVSGIAWMLIAAVFLYLTIFRLSNVGNILSDSWATLSRSYSRLEQNNVSNDAMEPVQRNSIGPRVVVGRGSMAVASDGAADLILDINPDCRTLEFVGGSELDWKDIWTTSVYSYAQGRRTPGGGLADGELRVGGWGDWYYSLLSFDVTPLHGHADRVFLLLYSINVDGIPVEMAVDRIESRWGWRPGDRLWWRDRPKTNPWPAQAPAPKRNAWYTIEITKLFLAWKAGEYDNFGLQLRPLSNNNDFNRFVSSRGHDVLKRPKLALCR